MFVNLFIFKLSIMKSFFFGVGLLSSWLDIIILLFEKLNNLSQFLDSSIVQLEHCSICTVMSKGLVDPVEVALCLREAELFSVLGLCVLAKAQNLVH